MDIRQRILDAAKRVYAVHGFRGATTRLIAIEADVNEVTLFRLFGSKAALFEALVTAGGSLGLSMPRRFRMKREQMLSRTGALVVLSVVHDGGSWTGSTRERFESEVASQAVQQVAAGPLGEFFIAHPEQVRVVFARFS